MSKQNSALKALEAQMARGNTPAQAPQTAPEAFSAENVVNLTPEAETPASGSESATGVSKPGGVGKGHVTRKGTVAASASRVSLYLPPKAKRKVEEIAFHTRRKEHDIFVEAIREYLEKHGHKGLL